MTTTNFFTGNPDLVEVFDKVIPWSRVVSAVEAGAGAPDGVGAPRALEERA